MGVRGMVYSLRSVVVNNLDVRWAGRILGPLKTDAPLTIDTNGMLPLAVSLQGFQTVGVERGKVAQRRSGIENAQTLLGLSPEPLPLADLLASRETLRVLVAETPYHPVLSAILDE